MFQELVTERHMQSIFTDVMKLDLRDPAHCAVIPGWAGHTAIPGAVTAWLSFPGDAHFAMAAPAGGITVVTLPPHNSQGESRDLSVILCARAGSRAVCARVCRQRVGGGTEEELHDEEDLRLDAHRHPGRAESS